MDLARAAHRGLHLREQLDLEAVAPSEERGPVVTDEVSAERGVKSSSDLAQDRWREADVEDRDVREGVQRSGFRHVAV